MRGMLKFALGGFVGAAAMLLPRLATHLRNDTARAGAALAHTEATFGFTAQAPMEIVAPLFGAERERVWAPEWNPRFLHPAPAKDQRGMVFTVSHGHADSIWINTQLDLARGVVQYVYVMPGVLTTVILLHLTGEAGSTHVEVTYARTALRADANDRVQHLAEQDRAAGPEWERQINAYLRSSRLARF